MPITKRKTSYFLDLSKKLEGLSKTQKTKAKNEVAEFVVSKIQDDTQKKKSPVTGDQFEPLSKVYKKFKKAQGKGGNADLFLDGLMLGDIDAKNKSDGVEFKITDKLSKLKSHNHNLGVTLPRRPFIPNDAKKGKYGTFNKEIRDGINQILRKFKRADKG